MIKFIVYFISAYLLGSIPTAIIIGKIARGIDIREHGSGNAGATNTFRVLGAKLAIPVTIVDLFKGLITPLLFQYFFPEINAPNLLALFKIICGILAIVGHIFPVFAGFRGGKGVLTSLGVVLALTPMASLIALAVAIVILFTFKIVSLTSLSGAFCYPIFVFFFNRSESDYYFYFACLIAVLIFFTHRTNIKRLIQGTEKKIIQKKT